MKNKTIAELKNKIKYYDEIITSHESTKNRIKLGTSNFVTKADKDKALNEAEQMIKEYDAKIKEIEIHIRERMKNK